jgi:CheY-like chemotaxis protein
MVAAEITTDLVNLAIGLAWPVVIGAIAWRLLPTLRRVLASRGFTIHAGGMEISVQEASDALGERVEDLREQVLALKARLESGGAEAASAPIAQGLPGLAAVLWVDDYPENNAFEVEALQRKDVRVLQASTTDEGLRMLDAHPDTAALITDMGRTEDGRTKDEAGLELIAAARERRPELPILVYASAPAIARSGGKALAAGASCVTSSATELFDRLGRIGLR